MSKHEMTGVVFNKSHLPKIIADVQRQQKAKRDFIYPITTAFTEDRFRALMEKLNAATADKIAEPTEAVANVTAAYGISDERKAMILAELLHSGDRSRYGLIQAITSTAHIVPQDEASRLEEVGGELASMSSSKFGQMVAA